MKKFFTKEVSIAISTLVCVAILLVGIEFLKGVNLFQPANYYYINYQDVTGLTLSTPVYVDGYKAGLVHEIEYQYDNPGNVKVTVSLEENMKVPEGTKAMFAVDILGVARIDLLFPPNAKAYEATGGTLAGINAPDMMKEVQTNILPQVTQMLPKVDSILSGLQMITTHPALTASLDRVDYITSDLQSSSAQLKQIMSGDVPALLHNITNVTQQVDTFTTNLNQLDIQNTVATLNTTLQNLEQLTQQLNSPDNTVGLLLNDEALYNDLVKTVNSADSLLMDLRLNPKRYVSFSLF